MAKEDEDQPGIIPLHDRIPELEIIVAEHTARILASKPFRVTKKYERVVIPKFDKTQRREEVDFWVEQIRRCREGYDGMPGRYYFFYNFCKIKHKKRGTIQPDLRAWQFHFAITKERIQKTLGLGLVTVKRRQVGMSWDFAADNIYDCIFNRHFDIGMNSKGEADSQSLLVKHKFIHRNLPKPLRALVSTDRRDAMIFSRWDKNKGEWSGTGSSIISVAPTPVSHSGNQYKKLVIDEAGEIDVLEALFSNAEDCVCQDTQRVGSIFMFGCVCAGTKIWTNNGDLINIEDLTPERGILGYKDGIGVSKEEITWWQPPQEKECIRLTTNTGRVLECSDDHPILRLTNRKVYLGKKISSNGTKISAWGDLKQEFREAGSLKVNDRIAVIGEVPVWGNQKMWEPRFIGWLVGDGTYRVDATPRLSNCEEEINAYVEKFDIKRYRGHITKLGKHYKETDIRGICPKLRELGIYGQTGYAKTLPKNIHSYCKEDAAEFIGGLFDTDGYSQFTEMNKSISLTSMSYNLLDEVRMLLQKFGIHCHIKRIKMSLKNPRDKNDHFRLTIAAKSSVLKFHKEIKFFVKFKQDNLEKMVVWHDNKVKPKNGGERRHNLGTRYERVIRVESIGKKPVYNLTAGTTHTYIANGIVTHNTMGDTMTAGKGLMQFYKNNKAYNFERYPVWGYNGMLVDDMGNDMIEDAVRWIIYERKRKEAGSTVIYNKYLQKYPLEEADMFLSVSGAGVGNPKLLAKRYSQLMETPANQVKGWMRPKAGGGSDFVPDPQGKIIIYERPQMVLNGYVSACDPAEDDDVTKSRDNSNLSTGIMSRPYGLNPPKIVAEYTDRPQKLADYYQQLALLTQWYATPVLIEMNKGGYRMKDWFELHFPKLLALSPKSGVSIKQGFEMRVGIKMSPDRKKQMMGLLDGHIESYWEFLPSLRFLEECKVFGGQHEDDDFATAIGWCLVQLQTDKRVAQTMDAAEKLKPHHTLRAVPSQGLGPSKTFEIVVNGNPLAKATRKTGNALFDRR